MRLPLSQLLIFAILASDRRSSAQAVVIDKNNSNRCALDINEIIEQDKDNLSKCISKNSAYKGFNCISQAYVTTNKFIFEQNSGECDGVNIRKKLESNCEDRSENFKTLSNSLSNTGNYVLNCNSRNPRGNSGINKNILGASLSSSLVIVAFALKMYHHYRELNHDGRTVSSSVCSGSRSRGDVEMSSL